MNRTILLILVLSVTSFAQTIQRETSLLTMKDGKAVVKAASLDRKTLPDRWHLKPGQYLVTRDFDVTSTATELEEAEDPLTVSSEGFTAEQQAAIGRALNAWNVGAERFIYQGEGRTARVTIVRQRLDVAAYSVTRTEGARLVSALILVDPSVTNVDALQSTIAHEAGHVLGMADTRDRGSIMFHKTKGKNRDNGHTGPTKVDLETLRR